MILLWLALATTAIFAVGVVLGYYLGHADGREERAREEWRDLN
jgi:hypothetical protein